MDNAEVLEALSAALAAAGDWFHVADAIRVGNGGEELAPHRAAFSYMLVERTQEEYRGRYGPLAPMIETAAGVYPTPLDRLPLEAAGIWAEALGAIEAPLLQARYGDLLWCVRHGHAPHLYARAALAGYEVLTAGDDELMTATHSTQRALEIALEVNDREAVTRISAAAVARAVGLLAAGPERPGIALRLLEAAAALPERQRPTDLTEAVLLAERVYAGDARLWDAVADLLASLTADGAARRDVRRRQVDIQHALELATLHHLTDLAAALRLRLQATLLEPIELQEVGGEVEVPRDAREREIVAVVGDDTAVAALRRLAARCPSGDPAAHVRAAEQMREQHPIQFLVTRVILSEENIPLRIFTTPDEHLLAHTRQQEVMAVRVFAAVILVPAIDAIVARYGAPGQAELAAALGCDAIDADTAGILAEQVVAIMRGDADEAAAYLLVPRLERVIRELARRAGLLVIREPSGAHAGGVRSLGQILSDLEGVLPEGWRRYYACLLTDDLGINLRNRIAHGLIERVERQDAALLAHAAISLSLFEVRASGD